MLLIIWRKKNCILGLKPSSFRCKRCTLYLVPWLNWKDGIVTALGSIITTPNPGSWLSWVELLISYFISTLTLMTLRNQSSSCTLLWASIPVLVPSFYIHHPLINQPFLACIQFGWPSMFSTVLCQRLF